MPGERNTPLKTALAAATVAALLLAYRHYDGQKGLDPAIFQSAAKLNLLRHPPAPPTPPPPPTVVVQKPDALPQISPFLIDDSDALAPFYAALSTLDTHTASSNVTVLHYGDSPTTADLITADIRQLFQQRFGDAGHGYLLPAKPWAWYGHRDTDISDHGWEITPATTSNRESLYGLGGARVEGGSGADSHITLKGAGQTAVEIDYLAQPSGGTLTVLADGNNVATIDTAAATRAPAWQSIPLPATAKSIDLKPTSGSVTLFGESFQTPNKGILYDSLGLNGAFTTVLSSAMTPAVWAAELRHTAPALVVINYGTNESGFGPYVDKSYEATLRTAIARIRAALPDVAILVMSPMDRGRRAGVDEISTYDTIPRIVAIQRRVAAEQHCAFFDTFNAMGGTGTMSRWYTGHPRLVAGDLIHPSPQGATIVGTLVYKDLMLGYDRYQKHQPNYRAPAPAPALAPAPAKPEAAPHA